jgi:hypothetical protein
VYCCIGRSRKQSSLRKRQQCKWNQWNGFYVVGYHSIMWKQAYLANDNETWVDDFGLVSMMACFAWTKRVGQWTSLDQRLKNESRMHKWGNAKQRLNDKGHNSYWI